MAGGEIVAPGPSAALALVRRDASRGAPVGLEPRAPAPRAAGQDMGVVEEAIQEGSDGRGVAEELSPVLDGPIRSDQSGGPFVAPHDDLQQILARGGRQLAHAEVIDDEQRDGGDVAEVGLAGAGELGVGEFFEKHVGLAVADAVALLDDGEADGLGEMAFPRARRPEEQCVGMLGDEVAGGEFEDETAVHLLVEVAIESVQPLVGVPEARLLHAAGEQPVLATEEFVADEGREEVDRRQLGGLGLEQAGLEGGGHAGAAELAEGALQFDEVHVGISSWAFRVMRSR